MAQTKICNSKNCPHKGKPQPIENFVKQPCTPDGRRYDCKTCANAVAKKRNDQKILDNAQFYKMIFG